MTFEEDNSTVRIPISVDMINNLFKKRKEPWICTEGLVGDYICRGVIQEPHKGLFCLLFTNKYSKEGNVYKDFIPTYKKVDCLDKERVKEVIDYLLEGLPDTYKEYSYERLGL